MEPRGIARRATASFRVAFALGLLLGSVAAGLAQEPAPDTEPDWPGSISLFDSQTRLAVGGFVKLDLIHDTNAIATRCEFVTAAIATDGGTLAGGADGQTTFCVNATRLTLETRTPTRLGRLKTFISLDLFDDPNTPSLRMRQAYGELSGVLAGGDLLLGQAWGTFVDLEAWPDVLDFEGPGSAIAVRQPMVRWTKGVSGDVEIRLALEQPGGGSIAGTAVPSRWPDVAGVLKWIYGSGSHLRVSGILRDVRASVDDGPAESALGWGIAGSGKALLGATNNLVFEASYGEGTGGYYGDGAPNAVIDPTNSSLELLPLFAYYVAFEHEWSQALSSSLLFSSLEADYPDAQPRDAGRRSRYGSLNLIWRPDPQIMFGIEFLRGERQDNDGATGTDNRIQLSSQFTF